MKFAAALVVVSAMLAMAKPVQKRVLETDVIIEFVTVTVTDGISPTSSAQPSSPSTTFAPPPPPPAIPPPPSPAAPPAAPSPIFIQQPPPSPSPTAAKDPLPAPPPSPPPTTTPVLAVQPTPQPVPPPAAEPATPPPPPVAPPPAAPPQPVAQASPPVAQASTLSPFAQTCVDAHNLHRRNHSAPDATWDSDLAADAQTLANSCVWGHNLNIGQGNYGQNIADQGSTADISGSSPETLMREAIHMMWYNGEAPVYAGLYGQADPNMKFFEQWGHFTQLVWKASTTLGCGITYCPNGKMTPGFNTWFMVCNYQGRGNVLGAYADNVGVPLKMPGVTA